MGAAGYTMPLPEKDEMFRTRSKMKNQIIVDLGGRVAEEIIFGQEDVTTGASQDFKQATKLARRMVTAYGMSDKIGVMSYDEDDDEVFIGRDLAHGRSMSEETLREIDLEVKRIIGECYEKARALIQQHKDILDRTAELLLVKEKIDMDEFNALWEG